jgi:hypothetical protein
MKIKKTYEVSGDGRITIYPPLYESKEGNKSRLFLKKLLHLIRRQRGHVMQETNDYAACGTKVISA